MYNVLFAHQSTIPHYRVPFFNALERQRPSHWTFDVVFDHEELHNPTFFKEPLDHKTFHFSTLDVRTRQLKLSGKRVSYQTFWRPARKYDLLILENALNNLAYPLNHLHQLHGVKIAYWGHGFDHSVSRPTGWKSAAEIIKTNLTRRADGFFAYTKTVKNFLVKQGVVPQNIFVVNNTIDIIEQRNAFSQLSPQRQAIKEKLGVADKKVLLFVGRFTPNKRIGFLLEAFEQLVKQDPSYHLFLVGSGGEANVFDRFSNITYFGTIVSLDQLAPIYVASDCFTFPGSVGLGPLQALCYDLPVVTISSPTHMPEIEYLQKENAIILDEDATILDFAQTINNLFEQSGKLAHLHQSIWPSIQHLTVEAMANRFIEGINTLLASSK